MNTKKLKNIKNGMHKKIMDALASKKSGLTKKELADRIGVQRTSLSRELQKMKNEGLLEYDKSSISVLNQKILF